MISLHTPPGTKLLCITKCFCLKHQNLTVQAGEIVTLQAWVMDLFNVPCILIEERDAHKYGSCYNRVAFRRLDLPKVLTDILNNVPTELEPA